MERVDPVQTYWTGRCESRGLAVLGIGIGLVVLAVGAGTAIALRGAGTAWVGWLVAVVGLVVGVAGWVASSLVAVLTEETFTVRFGPVGVPRRTIALADVADASAVVVEPLEWGGWGYRWIPWARASAAVIRRGPGIVLRLKDGRRFAVTVEDAVDGAKLTSAALLGARRP
ncbi:MAG: hypothetical protein GC157_15395 [Frankiales bacterium]|nr:hypothetical protein [Frankiales bacterium]